MKRLALYFFAGAGLDALITLYYISISSRLVFLASILSMLITAFSVLVISGILERGNDKRRKMSMLLSYALGNGVGTAVAMILK